MNPALYLVGLACLFVFGCETPSQVRTANDCQFSVELGRTVGVCDGYSVTMTHFPRLPGEQYSASGVDEGFINVAERLGVTEKSRSLVTLDGVVLTEVDAVGDGLEMYWLYGQTKHFVLGSLCTVRDPDRRAKCVQMAKRAVESGFELPAAPTAAAVDGKVTCKLLSDKPLQPSTYTREYQCPEVNMFVYRVPSAEASDLQRMFGTTLPGDSKPVGRFYAAGRRWPLWRSQVGDLQFFGTAQRRGSEWEAFSCKAQASVPPSHCVAMMMRLITWGSPGVGVDR